MNPLEFPLQINEVGIYDDLAQVVLQDGVCVYHFHRGVVEVYDKDTRIAHITHACRLPTTSEADMVHAARKVAEHLQACLPYLASAWWSFGGAVKYNAE